MNPAEGTNRRLAMSAPNNHATRGRNGMKKPFIAELLETSRSFSRLPLSSFSHRQLCACHHHDSQASVSKAALNNQIITGRDCSVSRSSRRLRGFVVRISAMSHPEESAQAVKSEQTAPTSAQQQQQQASSSCRKKKSESTSFFGDVVDHIDEFVNASYDEHKTCLQRTLNKMFGMSKAVSNGTGTTSAAVPVENVMSRPATTE